MVTLEQIKLLESKLTRAINFVSQLTEENSRLRTQNDELEETINALKEEKIRVEEGIVSALGKLNQFEDAIERSLGTAASAAKSSPKPVQKESTAPLKTTAESPVKPSPQAATQKPAVYAAQNAAPENLIPAEKAKPVMPSAYSIDEPDLTDSSEEASYPAGMSEDIDEIEDSGEAELDIF